MYQMDEYILNGHKPPKKKKSKGLFGVFFFILLISLAIYGAYWYYLNYIQETPKMAFFKYMGQNNFSNVFNTDIYYTMIEKMEKQSFKTETTANLTTTIENEFTQSVDVSKFELAVNTILDKENEESVIDAKINYSSNDIFDLKLINTKDYVAIGSNEILDKYIATSKSEYANSIKRTTGIETTTSTDDLGKEISSITNNKIILDEAYKTQKIKEYSDLVFNLIPEESVTKNESIVVTIDSKTINAEAYTLSVDANKYKEILSNVLTNLKNDKELLNKIITNKENINETQQSIEENPEETINPLPNVQVDYTGAETEQHQTSLEIESQNEQLEVIQDNTNQTLIGTDIESTIETEEVDVLNNELEIIKDVTDETLVKDEIVETETDLFEDLILAFVFNQKIEGTTEELINQIDTELQNIDKLNEGVKITVYVKNEEGQPKETIKLVVEFPNKINVDIEYKSDNQFKITYLQENQEAVTKGYSIDIKRELSDVKTKLDIQVGNIENAKVIKKTQIELETEGSKTSKDYKNEAIVKYNDNEENVKINIKNTIKFDDVEVEEILNDENSIFVDKITDEEASTLYMQVLQNIMQAYTEKVENLNFIDNNSSASVVQQPEVEQNNEEEKNVIRQKLIDTVSNMMGQAQENGTNLTIQDLADLQIEGFNVSSIVTEELATIKINGYTFKIDQNFMLSEE